MRLIDDHPVKRLVNLGFEPSSELTAFVRSSILGPQGTFLKHIQSQTGTRVQLRGKGSGFVDLSPSEKGTEKPPLHIFIAALSKENAEKAVKLAEDLIATVKANYDQQVATKAYYDYAQYYTQYMAYYQNSYTQ